MVIACTFVNLRADESQRRQLQVKELPLHSDDPKVRKWATVVVIDGCDSLELLSARLAELAAMRQG